MPESSIQGTHSQLVVVFGAGLRPRQRCIICDRAAVALLVLRILLPQIQCCNAVRVSGQGSKGGFSEV